MSLLLLLKVFSFEVLVSMYCSTLQNCILIHPVLSSFLVKDVPFLNLFHIAEWKGNFSIGMEVRTN